MRPRLLDIGAERPMILDDADARRLSGHSIYLGVNGYAYFSTNRTGPTTVHSFVMRGSVPGAHIDHINGNKLDNRRANLRVVSPQINQVNRKRLNRNNTSGIRGVARTNASRAKPWRAQITVARRNLHLGLFATMSEAIAARQSAEMKYYGEECPR